MLSPIFWKTRKRKELTKDRGSRENRRDRERSFFFSLALVKVEELKDVSVPWLNVDGECSRTLIATPVKHIISFVHR
jgi:hypothetical protein